MSTRRRSNRARRSDPTSSEMWVLALLGLLGLMGVYVMVWAGSRMAEWTEAGPLGFLSEWATGVVRIPAWLPITALVLSCGVLVLLGLAVRGRSTGTGARVDSKAQSMAQAADLREMLARGARADAERLGATRASQGIPVARLIPRRETLFASWEWVQTWIMGPRAGKTTCVCVRQVLETQGPVVATTNKRDLVDMTRGARGELGTVWVFDPQDIIGEEPSWWWNPLSYVKGIAEAQEVAGLFAASSKDTEARTDAYFDTEAMNYLSSLLLAAAAAEEPITAVHKWASRPEDDTPVQLLRLAGHDGVATTLQSIIGLTDRQRDGVVGTARKMISWLANPAILPWITPQSGRREFSPHDFVRSTETLYLVSKEGRGTTRAVTVALTVATLAAAEDFASHSPRGRLPVPMMVVLDEAANVVRWPELPDLYSHFGSRGIVLSTFLQSWNQGVAVWGKDGMEKLWSASNLRVVGAGVAQADFLNDVATLISDHDVVHRSVSKSGRSGQSTSLDVRRERIFETGELSSLPRGRAVMLSSGAPAALIELVHWSEREYAQKVRDSEAHFTGLAVTEASEAV